MFNNGSVSDGLSLGASCVLSPLKAITLGGEISCDYIIPESLSDTQKVLMTACDLKITDMEQMGEVVTVCGVISYNVLLLGDDGSLGSIKTNENFELKDVVEGLKPETVLVLGTADSYPEARLVNPRKLNLKAKLQICANALNEVCVTPSISGTETIDDDICLKRQLGNIVSAQTVTLDVPEIPVSYDITLDGNFPPMADIIYSRVKVTPFEIKARGNQIDVKTNACYSCIYKSEEGNIFSLDKSFLLEKTVEADDAESFEWCAMTTSDDLSAEISADSYGESKIIELDFVYCIILNGIKNTAVDCVSDMYSTEHECTLEFDTAETVYYKRAYSSSLSVNASAEREDLSAQNVRSVMLGNVTLRDTVTEYSPEKKKLIVGATAIISTVCENNITSDTDVRYSTYTFEYPFKCELDVGEVTVSSLYTAVINASDARFRCDQGKLYCDFESNIKIVATEKNRDSYVRALSLDKNSPIIRVGSPITLCYPGGSESLWDIAKHYKVNPESIIVSNGLSDGDIKDKKVLLIPAYRSSRPVFTKVD